MSNDAGPILADGTVSPVVVQAVRRLLSPLARFLIRQRIPFAQVAEWLKQAYVREACLHDHDGTEPTASRIHLLTGVHRKDVRRLREAPADRSAPPATVSLAGQMIARWTGDRHYLDATGAPSSLPRQAEGREPSFATLVEDVFRKDLRPGAVLDELLRLGVVELVEDNVRLRAQAFVPDKSTEDRTYYLGRNVSDHLAAAVDNVAGRSFPLPERSVYYGGLSAESVEVLRNFAREEGMRVLQAGNALALQLKQSPDGQGQTRMNFGFYFFEEPVENSPP